MEARCEAREAKRGEARRGEARRGDERREEAKGGKGDEGAGEANDGRCAAAEEARLARAWLSHEMAAPLATNP